MTPPEEANVNDQPEAESTEKKKLSLDIQVESPSSCERHITVTITREDVDRYFDDAVKELLPEAQVPGFRSGHAPKNYVVRRFRKELTTQIKGSLLMDAIAQVSEEQDFAAISEPDFDYDAIEVPKEGPMAFEFNLEVRPEFDMPQWKGLAIEAPFRDFTDEDIDDRLKDFLSEDAELVESEEPVAAGDFITLDMTFKTDGKELSQFKGESVYVRPDLSFSDATLTGFGDLVAGAKIGDVKESTLTLSKDLTDEELQGATVAVTLEVTAVKKVQLPELTQEVIETMGDYDNEEELREAVKKHLEQNLGYQRNRQIREAITSQLTGSAGWDLPPEMLRRQSHRELERTVMELQSSGFSMDMIQTQINDLRQNVLARTETSMKEHFILERIADEEKIEPTDSEYEWELTRIAVQSGENPRRIRARYEKRGLMDVLRNQIIENKVVSLIEESATITNVDFQPDTRQVEAIDLAISGEQDVDIPEAEAGGE